LLFTEAERKGRLGLKKREMNEGELVSRGIISIVLFFFL
jgi:hypothetical protein